MKVLLINGSPHQNGTTFTALKEVEKTLIEEGIETEFFWIGNKPTGGCIGCMSCTQIGKCVFDNDKVNEFVEKAKDFDGFIFGSPVHYAAMGGNIASFMDRVFYSSSCASKADYFKYKPAAAVVCARRGGSSTTFDQLNKYFSISQMPIISSSYWNMVHGRVAEDAPKDEEGMLTMRRLARNMAYFLKCIDAGKKQGVEKPKQEDNVRTNFIK